MSLLRRLGHIYYLSGVVGVLIIIRAFMIRYIIIENSDTITPATRRELELEVRQRLVVGPVFLLSAVLSVVSSDVGTAVFVTLVVFIIGWNAYTRRRRSRVAVTRKI
ncbi:MAG: hypothetical protein JRN15_18510 [Nitrososphaerota archaeon]|nr:hypothetical protein [Nitrososphaerota archaeon]